MKDETDKVIDSKDNKPSSKEELQNIEKQWIINPFFYFLFLY